MRSDERDLMMDQEQCRPMGDDDDGGDGVMVVAAQMAYLVFERDQQRVLVRWMIHLSVDVPIVRIFDLNLAVAVAHAAAAATAPVLVAVGTVGAGNAYTQGKRV